MKSKDPTKKQMELEKLQEENCWRYETLNGWPRLAVWVIKSLTAYLNYFSYTANLHKIKKNPEIVEVEMKSIVGVLPKKNLSAPYDGWSALESSLETHGYNPEKFNYIELNRERIISSELGTRHLQLTIKNTGRHSIVLWSEVLEAS